MLPASSCLVFKRCLSLTEDECTIKKKPSLSPACHSQACCIKQNRHLEKIASQFGWVKPVSSLQWHFLPHCILFPQKRNSVFLLRRQLSGEKAQKSGRALCGSVTSTKPRNHLIYLILSVCTLGRIQINDCSFSFCFCTFGIKQSLIVNNSPIQLSVSALIPPEKSSKLGLRLASDFDWQKK